MSIASLILMAATLSHSPDGTNRASVAVVPWERGRAPVVLDGEWKWIDASSLELQGRPFADADGFYSRLPSDAKKDVSPGTWAMSRCTAGMSFVFRTTSPKLRVRWSLSSGRLALTHMPATGVSGVDLYIRTENGTWRFVKAGFPGKRDDNEFKVSVVPGRLYRLYLPLYNGIKKVALGVVSDAELVSVPLPGAGNRKPVAFYGGSVVQGACSSRPGNSWVNIAGRMLDCPTVSMGFDGQGKMALGEADMLAKIDASAYCFLTLGNMHGDTYRADAERFLRRLAQLRPGVPLIFGSFHYPLVDDRGKHAFAAELKAKLQKEDPEKWAVFDVVSLDEMCSKDCDGSVDGGHPNDYGAYRMAEAFSAAVRRAFGKTKR